MKRSLLTLCLLSACVTAQAGAVFHPSGENLTYGEVANHQSLMAYTNNPATGASSLDNMDWNIGFGIVSSFGIGYEVGAVDNLTDNIDGLSDRLNAFTDDNPPSIDDVNSIKADFDDFLLDAGENGYFQINTAVHVPLFPLVWSSRETLGGSLVFDANLAAQAQLRVLDRPIEYNPLEQGSNQLQTNSAVYLKVGAVAEGSLGYSRPLFEFDSGTLYAGLKAKYYQVGLRKTLIGLSQMEDSEQAVEDEVDKDSETQNAVGVDLGLLWVSQNYRLGATFKNVNSPSFDYDVIGNDCENIAPGPSQDSCFIARSFADEIDMEESYVMDAQVSVEASLYSDSKNWVLSFAADTSPVNDPVGNQIQWMTASAAYATPSFIIPGIRVGYRKNMAGSELSAVTAGFTLFKFLHIDAAYGLESIVIDEEEAPRMLQANVGIDLLF